MLGRIFVGSFNTQTAAIPHAGEVVEVGQPSGACFVMRREVWQKLKGFDEGFFLWYEDVDLAKRLHNLGYRNMVVGSAAVEHAGARAFVQIDGRQRQAIRLRSVERYIRLHHPKVAHSLPDALAFTARPSKRWVMSYFSIVIPTKDRVSALAQTLSGLEGQRSNRDFEVVVVDNGSSEESLARERAMTAAATIPIKMIEHPECGPAAARNAGAAASSGEVILFLGDDTEPHDPTLLQAHIDLHDAHPEDAYGVLGRITWDPRRPITPLHALARKRRATVRVPRDHGRPGGRRQLLLQFPRFARSARSSNALGDLTLDFQAPRSRTRSLAYVSPRPGSNSTTTPSCWSYTTTQRRSRSHLADR